MEYKDYIMDWIYEAESRKPLNFNLLIRASRDGFDNLDFHERCDEKGPTIAFIKAYSSDNKLHIFGGYNDTKWPSNVEAEYTYPPSPKGFIFTLVNAVKVPPTKFVFKDKNTTYVFVTQKKAGNFIFGFGGGPDICIRDKNSSYANFPCVYTDENITLEGYRPGSALCGGYSFKLEDYEVFEVDFGE